MLLPQLLGSLGAVPSWKAWVQLITAGGIVWEEGPEKKGLLWLREGFKSEFFNSWSALLLLQMFPFFSDTRQCVVTVTPLR
jgi:hypothetical protein